MPTGLPTTKSNGSNRRSRPNAKRSAATQHFPLLRVAGDIRVWSLACLFGCALVGIYGLFLWLPQIVKSLGHLSNIEVGFLSAAPPLAGRFGHVSHQPQLATAPATARSISRSCTE